MLAFSLGSWLQEKRSCKPIPNNAICFLTPKSTWPLATQRRKAMELGCGGFFTPGILCLWSHIIQNKDIDGKKIRVIVLGPPLTGYDFPVCKMGAAAVPTQKGRCDD